MTTDTNPPGTAWMQIVKKKGTSDFATSFTADASLQTSALSKAVVGPTLIGAFFAATSTMYEHFAFTAETVDGAKTYLEWEGTRYAVEKVGVSQDDVTLMMYAVPLENMSFGGGKLVSDIDLSMPWVNK